MAITLNGTTGITTPDLTSTDDITANGATVLTSASTTVLPKGVPAFRAWMNNGGTNFSFSNSVITKIPFDTITFDTDSFFDNTTNYRFQPTIAGYYQITLQAHISYTSTGGNVPITYIYKNGSLYSRVGIFYSAVSIYGMSTLTDIVYFNGSTDYVEGYVYYNSSSAVVVYGSHNSFMSGVLVRAD